MTSNVKSMKKFKSTSLGRIAYLEAGNNELPPVLFVHGIPTSGYLWRNVISELSGKFHCYAPDLMGLGDTEVDNQNTNFDMDSQAEMLAEFMAAQGHKSFALVCHDQGGAASQILAAKYPERIEAFVITNCVGYDNWPVPEITFLQRATYVPFLLEAVVRSGLLAWVIKNCPPLRMGVYNKSNMTEEITREYLRMGETHESWDRFMRFTRAGDPRYTMRNLSRLKEFKKPTRIIWAGEDKFLSISWAQRFLEDIPGADQIEIVPFCGHFWQEEKPREFAEKIGKFLSAQPFARKQRSKVSPKSSLEPELGLTAEPAAGARIGSS